MTAAFFQGTLGNFAWYNSFGSIGAGGGFAARQLPTRGEQQPVPQTNDARDQFASQIKASVVHHGQGAANKPLLDDTKVGSSSSQERNQ